MMTIPMGNDKENSSRERAQHLFKMNVELENNRRKAAQAKVPSDPNTWQQMRENYEAIILEDHAFSEQHDIEYALWQLHYKRIEELRALFNAAVASAGSAAPQNGKSPLRSGPDRVAKIRSQFKTFLSEATGFYHDLMLKIRAKYGLPLGYFSDVPENQIPLSKDGNKSTDVKNGLISCHRCLIYLGDLARYKGLYGEGDSKAREFTAASSYYMQASSLCPSNGNPHHQLAILAGYSNDELVSIYRYFRSLAVENPFTTARDNLIIAFEKNRQNYTRLLGDGKATTVKTTPPRMSGKRRGKGDASSSFKDNKEESSAVEERVSNSFELFKAFITRFVRLNGILFTRTSLEMFAEVLSTVKSGLLELLSSGPDEDYNFGPDAAECRLAVLRMIAILIYTLHNLNKENENQSYAEILQRTVVLQNAFTATFEFMGCVLDRCYQLNDPSSSYLLPGIMVFVEWLACRSDVSVGSELEEKQVNARSFFWNKCVSLLNKLLSNGYTYVNEHEEETCFSNMSKYDETETANRLALSEDFELRGFLPLVPAQLILDFSRKHSYGGDGGNREKISRVQRIIAAGKALANVVRIGQDGLYFDTKLKKFVIGIEPKTSDDYLLASSLEPTLNDTLLDSSVADQKGFVNPEVAEDDDEDEVILFRPSANERHIDDFSSNLASSELIGSVGGAGRYEAAKENGSFPAGLDSSLLQNASIASITPSAAVANAASQYLLPVSSMSNWPVEQASIANGLAHMNFTDTGSLGSELQHNLGISQPTAVSLPYPHFVSNGAADNYPIQISQALGPSKFDSIITSGLNQSSIAPLGLKKNPVSRPVRHLGPPPGFGSVRSKVIDESLNMAVKRENSLPQMDDYTWLDGYSSSSVNQSIGFNNSINEMRPAFNSMSMSNGSMGIPSFPFPGKQASAVQVQGELQNGWQDYQLPEHMKLYAEQQQQHQHFHRGKQQTIESEQQFQGQSPWEGRFRV